MNVHLNVGRLGQRVPVRGVQVAWNTRGRTTPRWKRRGFPLVDVTDVSVSGAQVVAPDDGSVTVGDIVTIVGNGALGVVRIRRHVPLDHDRLAVFGIEFVELGAELRWFLHRHLDAGRPTETSVFWH